LSLGFVAAGKVAVNPEKIDHGREVDIACLLSSGESCDVVVESLVGIADTTSVDMPMVTGVRDQDRLMQVHAEIRQMRPDHDVGKCAFRRAFDE
jgi:hypothetical protein